MSYKHSLEKGKKPRIKLTITDVDSASLAEAEKEILKELSQNLKIKGFRPGKIPEKIVTFVF